MEHNTSLFDLILDNKSRNTRACDLIDKYYKYNKISFLNLIEYIDLSSCDLLELDPSITQFKNLRHLCLIGNKLTDLPLELSHLDNMGIIELQDNNLTHVPHVLCLMKNLHSIYLNNNSIKDLPYTLCKAIREPYPHRSKWYDI